MRLWGLDWSGAKRPGRSLWLAEGRVSGGELEVLSLRSLEDCLGERVREPARALADLRVFLRAQSAEAWLGIDAPLSIPSSELDALGLPDRSPEAWVQRFPSMETLERALAPLYRRRPAGQKERRRPCDRLASAPMAPLNLRVRRQTWSVSGWLAGWRREGGVSILPWDPPDRAPFRIMEVCPATLLRVWGGSAPYKGRSSAHHQQRLVWLRRIEREGLLLAPALCSAAAEQTGGDALDALLALCSTWRWAWGLRPAQHEQLRRQAPRLEGWVYSLPPLDSAGL